MHLYKFFASSLLSAGIMMTSCSSEQIEIPNDEFYAREFIKQFGVADPNHDWNNSAKGTVTVVTSSPTHVQVLADIKGKRYIFADYKNVNGKETINFTTPKSVTELIVTLNGRQFKTSIGGTVNASKGSRAIWEKHNDVVEITRTDYRRLTDEGVTAFKNYLPEGQNNLGAVTQNFSFISNGEFTIYPVYWQTDSYNTLGIYYIEGDEMVLVPFYTNKIIPIDGTKGNLLYTTSDPEAEDLIPANNNIQLIDEDNPLIIPNNDFSSELNPVKYNNNNLTSFEDFKDEDWKTFKRRWLFEKRNDYQWYFPLGVWAKYFDLKYITDFFAARKDLEDRTKELYISDILCSAADATHVKITNIAMGAFNDWIYPGDKKDSHPGEGVKAWESRGIHVKVAEGTRFGMYIRAWYNGDHNNGIEKPSIDNVDIVRLKLDPETGRPISDKYRRFYSEAKYNDVIGGSNVFGATYMYEAPSGDYRVLGFEDYGGDVHDLNDMMFFITSIDPENIPDVEDIDHPDPKPEKYEYLIAAEDLGGTCDWDFNDLVASVSLVTKNYSDDATDGTTFPYTEVTVTPLAAGGTLPVYLMYTGKISTSKDDYASATSQDYMLVNEFHSWLTGNDGTTPYPINVGESASLKGKSITFHVPGDGYTLGMHQKYNASDGKNNMGGFWVLAINDKDAAFSPDFGNGDLHPQTTLPEGEGKGITKIEAPTADQNVNSIAPQMICVGSEWLWPREGKKIHTAYTIFNNWVTDPTKTEWYGEGKYVESLVTKR